MIFRQKMSRKFVSWRVNDFDCKFTVSTLYDEENNI